MVKDKKTEKLCILGSTGSIGRNTLRVVSAHPHAFEAAVLTAKNNGELLLAQAKALKPKICVLTSEESAIRYASEFSQIGVELMMGEEALSVVVELDEVDTVVCALDGSSGFESMFRGVSAGKKVLFANKEAFVEGSSVIMPVTRERRARIVPIDSEHCAIAQCLLAGKANEVEKVILTASGGPFLNRTLEDLREVKMEEALAHPTWKMGASVTVNSATLFNKGLEVLEAKALFDIPLERIEVLIHPQSIVHGLVQFRDGSVLAQLSRADMAVAIQYALTAPNRLPGIVGCVDLAEIGKLEFLRVDFDRFPAVRLCYEAGAGEWWEATALCAMNEALVARFLAGEISFYRLSTSLPMLFAERFSVHRSAFPREELVPTAENVMKVSSVFREYGDSAKV